VGLVAAEVLALAFGSRLGPGASAGVGLTVVVVFAPLVAALGSVPGYGVAAAVLGGLLVVAAGFADRAAVAGTPTSPGPLGQ
jgi:hypothetical protein